MKLLFDQNLSFKLCRLLSDLFPESQQARQTGHDMVDDLILWDYAKANGFTIVTQDVDLANISLLRGHPPKVIWLRCGNQSTSVIERILREQAAAIRAFDEHKTAGFIELFR